jgi:RNA polymerase sigma-70 factor, ECF subfamily
MERYAAGDEAAFAVVYDALASRLYGYLLRQTRERARAEDLVQQTMLNIHRARLQFIPGSEVIPWAFAISRRLLLDGLRRGKREVPADVCDPEVVPGGGASAESLLQARELAARIERVLATIPASQRAAFELLKYEGLTVVHAAEVLGTTPNAVKIRAHRASEALRAVLGDAAGDYEGPER